MNDADLQHRLQQARAAAVEMDFSVQEYGFETRLTARLHALSANDHGTVALLWRAVAGCAALTGVLAVWFILAQVPHAAEDDLTAFWDNGQAAYDSDLTDGDLMN